MGKEAKMKTRKTCYIIGAVVLVIALLVGGGLFSSCGPHRFCGKGFHPPFHGKEFSRCVLERIDKKVEKLGLSEAQQQQYAEIRKKVEADFVEMSEKRKELLEEVRTEINREKPDMNKVAGLFKDRLKEMPKRVETHIDHFLAFYNILDENQKARLLEKIRKRIRKCKS
jgi:Spy/CpxP family protein refolding chaperone